MSRRALAGLAAALMAFATGLLATGAQAADPACRDDAVYLRGDFGTARFGVEIADDARERARGLMHRDSLPRSRGMLFIYGRPTYVSFWMRNTLIPLDMLFLDEHGVVQRVHHMATPLDETPIPGGHDILAVLEINGGLAKAMGLDEGTQLLHPAFGRDAAWPCP